MPALFLLENEQSSLEPVYFGHLQDDGSIKWRVGEGATTIFPDRAVPVDTTYDYISSILFSIYTLLALAGIIFAMFCLLFSILFRKKK